MAVNLSRRQEMGVLQKYKITSVGFVMMTSSTGFDASAASREPVRRHQPKYFKNFVADNHHTSVTWTPRGKPSYVLAQAYGAEASDHLGSGRSTGSRLLTQHGLKSRTPVTRRTFD